ncbi:MAG TPA: hypothetical protein VHZ78_02340 [Rhizomicrobium sp.]|jgi:hypothetical protein|nr:hypothetical protein [Rhizomicrobium sp.]
MDEELSEIEVRLTVLEALVTFQFAAQHMQTSDPAAAVARLRSLLLDGAVGSADERKAAVADALERTVQRILDLQEQLPRRLVD